MEEPRTPLPGTAAPRRALRGPRAAAAAGAADRLARLGDEVRRLDRLAGLGLLVAEVAHEVRNALTAVKTLLQILPARGHEPAVRSGFVGVAADEVSRIERLLDLLLEQAAPRGEREPADAAGVSQVLPARGAPAEHTACGDALAAIARLVEHRAEAAGVQLAVDVAPELPAVRLPADALRQVLLNLALNAVDATPRGGDVRLAARALGRCVEIRVEDRGPGVPRALRRRIFEPFFSTRPGRPGGLGLAISLRLVEEVGGTLSVAHRPGGGSRFRVRLPVA